MASSLNRVSAPATMRVGVVPRSSSYDHQARALTTVNALGATRRSDVVRMGSESVTALTRARELALSAA
eukprot:COSAG06_NODE_54797_length_292_cov_9.606218_1_plen_68_part_10